MTKRVNLALQGGGSHGAFTWGAVERILADPELEISGISGTSAGALNAAVLGSGYALGGRQGAIDALAAFWARIGEIGRMSPVQMPPWEKAAGTWRFDSSPVYLYLDMLSRLLSPYQLNPSNHNPVREALAASVDFEALRTRCPIRIFLSATNIRTGKIKVFETKDITLDAVMASACLPFMFQAVEIDGEAYYDGGYMGNPALFPVIYSGKTQDIIIVQINPLQRPEIPHSAREILDRVAEISFNSTLMREMRAVFFVTRLIETHKLDDHEFKHVFVHMIQDEPFLQSLHASSKLCADPEFLALLREKGQAAAETWISAHLDSVGRESTVDLVKTFM